eukprot:m.19860 g.19860  ORF g.19860 m.19860 type:complete len:108 (-) comp10965_c0_seq1:138-461(-)
MDYNFAFDDNGSPRAFGPDADKPLFSFLEGDVQGSDKVCQTLLELLTMVENTAQEREFNGNAHTVTMKHNHISIVNNYVETPPFITSLENFRAVLMAWRTFLLVQDE